MIEKLKEHDVIDPKTDKIIGTIGCDLREIMDKLNEVIDAVNKLQTRPENVQPDAKSHPVNVQDKFAEQRKWIGKLCRFWNFKDDSIDIGILKAVDNLKPTIPYINDIDCSYAYCEPVKPDDDIIYKDKGGDNE